MLGNGLKKEKNQGLIMGLSLLFIVLNSLLIANEIYYLALLPAALVILALYFVSLDKILILIAFVTPISVNLSDFSDQLSVSLPAEPLLAGLLLMVLFKSAFTMNSDRRILYHPVSLSLIFYFIWMLITSLSSFDILVSTKWAIAKLWFIIPVFFFGIRVFKKKQNILQFVLAYMLGLLIVIVYTLINHALNGFSSESGHWVMTPFYNDHTSYGAMLALYIPVVFGLLFYKGFDTKKRFLVGIMFVIFTIALVLSISRAAWASIVIAMGVFLILRFKIKFRWLLLGGVSGIVLIFVFWTQIFMKLERNKQDAKGGLVEHVESVSNVATDASNLERINRWKAALRMFKEKPLLGWGPGCYQFVYAPFQNSYDKTVISTNVGNRGTAHSEYLLILSEEGVLGLLSLLLVFVFISIAAIENHKNLKDRDLRLINMMLFLGLITYFAHAVFNNFLDTDKAAVPFWGFAAIIVAINIYYTKVDKKIRLNP